MEITLKLTVEEVNGILKRLDNCPHHQVLGL
jgi:hypothetical protein